MSTIFRIELLPALHGDCIMVEYGQADSPRRILIDGGPIGAYKALEARIGSLPASQRELDLFVITHIDADHIEGAIKLLNHPELGLVFKDIWFNGWPQLQKGLVSPPPASGDAATRSPLQGQFLTHRIGRRRWNGHFYGRAVFVPDEGRLPSVSLRDGMVITLLSPDAAALRTLRKTWVQSLDRLGMSGTDMAATGALLKTKAAYRTGSVLVQLLDIVQGAQAVTPILDAAVANGSSIAFLAEYAGKSCAFLADAHMPTVEASLRRLARERNLKRIPIDAVKVSHHGSDGNITRSFLQQVECQDYLISTDGSVFGHPDDAAVAMIISGAPGARLSFNYRTGRTEKWENEELRRRLGHRTAFPIDAKGGITFDVMAPSGAQ